MSFSGTTTRYGRLAQAFHWLTALLVLIAFLVSAGGPPERVYSAARASTLLLHESLGFTVFCLLVVRLIWRRFDRIPDAPAMPSWMEVASKATHWALYALLFAVPATAMVGALFGGHPVTVYGLGAIGPFSGSWGAPLAEIHGTLGDVMMWIAGLHAAAAIFHHFFLRDRVLSQMLPGLPDPSSRQGG
ncbi:cytochrome b [Mesorhizobium sp. B2-4-13]|uniref:cytochrome b n=1 Tax=unclassified Mesorhizobium TaxID=325217 RepID=UPI00114F32FD|nr:MULTISPECIES: cytochrome b [unclassified Mesorhizobium]MBZ9978396.1 cytochrome b [Mesorhizobium sp. BR-1-1-10]TPK82897.1 cytochrome b [Mesorhizobium sp. B2-4-13]